MEDFDLAPNFTLQELTVSEYAVRNRIANDPTGDPLIMHNLERLAHGLQRVRDTLEHNPVIIISGYRSPRVNKAIGGHPDSYHVKGLAADFICPGFGSTAKIADALATDNWLIEYDQLILEFPRRGGWVHIGFSETGVAPRYDLLTCHAKGRYQRGLVA